MLKIELDFALSFELDFEISAADFRSVARIRLRL